MIISLIFLCIILEAATQTCFKFAASESTFWHTLTKPIVWLGLVLWAVEVVLWMHILKTTPLSVAFPIMSLTYVFILITSAIIFKEHVNKRHALGAFLITAGVACIGATEI